MLGWGLGTVCVQVVQSIKVGRFMNSSGEMSGSNLIWEVITTSEHFRLWTEQIILEGMEQDPGQVLRQPII